VYETDVDIITTTSGEGHEIRRPVVKAAKVVEQRVAHFLMGLPIIGAMTGLLLRVLNTMPRAIFAGVIVLLGYIFSVLDSPTIFSRMLAKQDRRKMC
jgi:hypothetical protein